MRASNAHNAWAGRPMRSVPAFILVCVLIACSGQTPPPSPAAHSDSSTPTLDVVELSAVEARDRMAAGTLTSRALTQAYLDRIKQIDDSGPMLNAVIEINATAIADAEALDAERKGGKVRGPLHGIPILVKDNIDIVGMANSAGSLALADNRPKQDAFIVTRLRDAGAVILGKTNLSEWANFRSTRSTSGWSSRGGQTRNPYALDRNPCGSSSGTGAAIAASLASIGVGTETDGSIICPASVNGLVGLKPTVGLVSRRGIIPISATQDTAGPMARSVADAAMLLTALAAVDPGDPATESAKDRIPDDYGVAAARRIQGQAPRCAAASDRLSPGRRSRIQFRRRCHQVSGRGCRRRQDTGLRRMERPGARGHALRVQGRPQSISQGQRLAARLARRRSSRSTTRTPTQ